MKHWLKSTAATVALAGLMAVPAAALRADENAAEPVDKDQEMKVWMEHVNDSIESLSKKSDDSKTFRVEGFGDVRWDHQKYTVKGINNPTFPSGATPDKANLANLSQAGVNGMYAKRGEIKINGNLSGSTIYSLGYDFVANKVKDFGVEFSDIPVLPFDLAPEAMWSLRVGQYRMKFGVEPQTSSSKIDFAERSLINGGASPFGTVSYGAVSYTAGGKWVATVPYLSASTKLIGERAMGLHVAHKLKTDIVNYDVAASLANSLTEDQAVGQGAAIAGFPSTANDENPSVSTRVGIEPVILNNLLPFSSKIKLGASYANDSQNTSPDNTPNYSVFREELLGFDGILTVTKNIRLQGEWIAANRFGNQNFWLTDPKADAVIGFGGVDNVAAYGLINRREGWYATMSMLPLGMVMGDEAPKVELLGRYEVVTPNVHNWSNLLGTNYTMVPGQVIIKSTYQPYQISAVTYGLKYSYLGNCHTAVNVTAYAADGNFGALAGTELVVLQQQFAF